MIIDVDMIKSNIYYSFYKSIYFVCDPKNADHKIVDPKDNIGNKYLSKKLETVREFLCYGVSSGIHFKMQYCMTW